MEADEAVEAVTFSEVGQWVMLPLKRPHHHEVVAKVVTQIWKVEAAVNGLPEVTVVKGDCKECVWLDMHSKQGYALNKWMEGLSDEAYYSWESPKKID